MLGWSLWQPWQGIQLSLSQCLTHVIILSCRLNVVLTAVQQGLVEQGRGGSCRAPGPSCLILLCWDLGSTGGEQSHPWEKLRSFPCSSDASLLGSAGQPEAGPPHWVGGQGHGLLIAWVQRVLTARGLGGAILEAREEVMGGGRRWPP